MSLLPPPLRDALARAPRLVVAPVGIGFGQDALAAWAAGARRRVVREPEDLGSGPSLLLPGRRSGVVRIPRDLPLSEALVLEECDAAFDLAAWRAALADLEPSFVDASFEQCEGWPLGLELTMRIGAGGTPLHRHPLTSLTLDRLLPSGEQRLALTRAAATPLLTSDLHEPLGLDASSLDELYDIGLLLPDRSGLRMPRLLRRYLRPRPEPAEALATAHLLMRRRLLDAALEALAEADSWEAYLELLAEGFEPHSPAGEARLRRALDPIPSDLRERPSYLYLVGSLDRLRGDFDRALGRYRKARRHASKDLRPRLDNARGIVFALQGKLEEARKAFGAAGRSAAADFRLQGEARHNRAGVFVQLGRFVEAERDLRQAIASFRGAGDYVREARSLQLLALSRHQRGLFPEARQGYEEALELLGTLAQPTALLRVNLAEVMLLTGHPQESRAQLDLAERESRQDQRVLGYVEVNRALWLLHQGQPEAALRRLRALLRQEGAEAHLRAEADLLMARALRLRGETAEALAHAREAAQLGVGAALEEALSQGADLDPIVERARAEEARFELSTALLHRRHRGDLEEAFGLIRAHDYRILLDSPQHSPALAALAQREPAALALFPLRMRTFGGFRTRFLGRDLTLAGFPTLKSAALLLRLALASRPLPRQALAEEFWGDAGNPVQSLQTALYHLNRTFEVQVVGGRRGMVELAYPVLVDLKEFERAALEALDDPWTRGPESVRLALGLAAGGESLAEFPEWFEEERRAAETLSLRLWRRLAELEANMPVRAAEALEALLRIDPYDVDSHRNLIGIYSELGEPELARRQEEQLRALESEM